MMTWMFLQQKIVAIDNNMRSRTLPTTRDGRARKWKRVLSGLHPIPSGYVRRKSKINWSEILFSWPPTWRRWRDMKVKRSIVVSLLLDQSVPSPLIEKYPYLTLLLVSLKLVRLSCLAEGHVVGKLAPVPKQRTALEYEIRTLESALRLPSRAKWNCTTCLCFSFSARLSYPDNGLLKTLSQSLMQSSLLSFQSSLETILTWPFIGMQIRIHFQKKILCEDSCWNTGNRQLGIDVVLVLDIHIHVR